MGCGSSSTAPPASRTLPGNTTDTNVQPPAVNLPRSATVVFAQNQTVEQPQISSQLSLRNPPDLMDPQHQSEQESVNRDQNGNSRQHIQQQQQQSSDVLSTSQRAGFGTIIKQIVIIPPYDNDGNLQDEIQKLEIKSDIQTNLKRQQMLAEKQKKLKDMAVAAPTSNTQGQSSTAQSVGATNNTKINTQYNNNSKVSSEQPTTAAVSTGKSQIKSVGTTSKPTPLPAPSQQIQQAPIQTYLPSSTSRAVSDMHDFINEQNLLGKKFQSSESTYTTTGGTDYQSPTSSDLLNTSATDFYLNNSQILMTIEDQRLLQQADANNFYTATEVNLLKTLKVPPSEIQQQISQANGNNYNGYDYDTIGDSVNLLKWVKSKRPSQEIIVQQPEPSPSPLPPITTASRVSSQKKSLVQQSNSPNLLSARNANKNPLTAQVPMSVSVMVSPNIPILSPPRLPSEHAQHASAVTLPSTSLQLHPQAGERISSHRLSEMNRKNTFDTFNDTISNASPINQTGKQTNERFNFHTMLEEGMTKKSGGATIYKQESAMTEELEQMMRGIDDNKTGRKSIQSNMQTSNGQSSNEQGAKKEISFIQSDNNLICDFERHDSRDDQQEFQVSISSPRKNRISRVLHTTSLQKDVNEQGKKVINNYTLIKELGRGNCGKVKLAVDQVTGKQFAIKISNKNKLKQKLVSMKMNAFTLLEQEIAIMKKVDHPNIVKLHEVIEDAESNKLYMVMDFMRKGAILSGTYFSQTMKAIDPVRYTELYDSNGKIKNKADEPKSISIKASLKYMRQMALALDYMHNFAQIVHRDIKPDNLLVDDNDNLKVADFGISQIMQVDETSTNAGTKAFMAPESWEKKHFKATPLDIWATGITLYYMTYGMVPFREKRMVELKIEICTKEYSFLFFLGQQSTPEISQDMRDYLDRTLEKDPEKRITAKEMLTHPWLTNRGEVILQNVIDHTLDIDNKDLEKAIGKSSKFQASIMLAIGMKRALRRARNSIMLNESQSSTPGSVRNSSKLTQSQIVSGAIQRSKLTHQMTSPFLHTGGGAPSILPSNYMSNHRMSEPTRLDNISKFSSHKQQKEDEENEDDDEDESQNYEISQILKGEEDFR